ncbi:Type 1 glutamine amidotransferase-like domain-containing protein [Clostridium coskatii]|uniref:Peptidase family S51 n=1 Tax=Clostridium coskatii TaxID=1705578 RepID=A0A168QNJ4_9CLOT|nr:Type 1 glutamine amidotransferase-like domain-containing protein [Clostridium coskatii]OAA89389.1 Peptidase family S51 [Clostridium coskatii]OBR92390.1 peptidase family S51 [Clostridium coskatii]
MVNMLFSLYNFNDTWGKDAVSKYINCSNKVLIIPFSFSENIKNNVDWQNEFGKDNGDHYKSIIKPFLSYGIKKKNINCINYFEDTKENAKNKIKNSDILFFTGGLPDKMMYRLKEFDLVNEIENFTGTIIGSSAGAMIQIKEYHITPDEDYDTFSYNKGLNFIKDFDIEVHYKGTEVQKNYINKVLNEKTDTVYAIKNTGGIIVDNNSIKLLGDTQTFSR